MLAEEDIVEKIISTAKNISPSLVGVETKPSNELERLVMKLPEEYVNALLENDENTIKSIKGSTPLPSLPYYLRESKYLKIVYGFVPLEMIGRIYKTSSEFNAALKDYQDNPRVRCDFTVDLMIYQNSLPNRDKINYFVNNHVWEADEFILTGSRYIDRKRLRFAMNVVYEGLADKRKLRLLEDTTKIDLEKACLRPLKKILDYIKLEKEKEEKRTAIREGLTHRFKDKLDGKDLIN